MTDQAFDELTALPTAGRLFVLSGPSGVGKDTVLDCLLARVTGLVRSVSATTRDPRPDERNEVDYFFLARDTFKAGIERNEFLEYAEYGENLYGTPRAAVRDLLASGLDVVLKIEVQGALLVREIEPHAILLFVQPPSLEELERRLRSRNTDTEARVLERLAIARAELATAPQYDYLVTNDDVDAAAETVRAIVIAERHRIHHER